MRLWQQSMIFLARNAVVKHCMQSRATMSALAERFVGGRSASDAAEEARRLKSRGIFSSLFNLGEYVEQLGVIAQTVEELKSMAGRLARSHLDVHISVDPTQIGYQIDAGLCRRHAFDLADAVRKAARKTDRSAGNMLMLDMEDAGVTQATVDLHQALRAASLPAGLTLQAYLHRTESDLKDVIRTGGAVRLVKGAFAEGKSIAFTHRRDIDGNFLRLAGMMLSEEARENGFYPIFGTHDDHIIDRIIRMAHRRGWPADAYEFEMLYGVRCRYQEQLIRSGANLRLYLPFGTDWWPYAVRRVGENPKNAAFLIRSLVRG